MDFYCDNDKPIQTTAAPTISGVIATVELAFRRAVEESGSAERSVELYELARELARTVATWKDIAERHIIDNIPDLDCTLGTKRYYLAVPKVTKPRDPATTFTRLCDLLDGDFDAIARCLSASAVKYGAARAELTEMGREQAWDELFEVTTQPTVKEGKAYKRLLSADTRYTRGPRHGTRKDIATD